MKGDSKWTPRALKEVKGQISLHNLGALFKKEAKPKPFFPFKLKSSRESGCQISALPQCCGRPFAASDLCDQFLATHRERRLIHCGMGIEKGIMGGKKNASCILLYYLPSVASRGKMCVTWYLQFSLPWHLPLLCRHKVLYPVMKLPKFGNDQKS